jgi:chromosomal replication initiation ATPase DnaA
MSCPGCAALEQRITDIEARLAGLNPVERSLIAEPTVAAIVADAALILGCSADDIAGRTPGSELAEARRAVAWAARHSTRYTRGRIGKALGGRDGSTIRELVARAERRRGEDGTFRLLTDLLLSKARDRRSAALIGSSR